MRKFCLLVILMSANLVNAQHISRFMVVGDTHHSSPSPDFSRTKLYEITLAAIHEQADFIFFTGDLAVRGFASTAEEDSVLKDWRFVLDTLRFHNIKVFACRGNNDGSRAAWDSLFSGPYLFPQNGPENEKNITYAIEYDNLLFIALDLYTAFHKINQVWLDELLKTTDKKFIFAESPHWAVGILGLVAGKITEEFIFHGLTRETDPIILMCGSHGLITKARPGKKQQR